MLAKHIFDQHPEWLENLTVASPDVGGVWRARRMAKRLGELVQAGEELPLAVVVMQRDKERKKVSGVGPRVFRCDQAQIRPGD